MCKGLDTRNGSLKDSSGSDDDNANWVKWKGWWRRDDSDSRGARLTCDKTAAAARKRRLRQQQRRRELGLALQQ